MKTWLQCCEEVGYNPSDYKAPPEKVVYFAYANGKATECESREEAAKLSKNVEKYVTNKDEIKAYCETRLELELAAGDIWRQALNEEYAYLKPEVLSVCYNKAWEDGHSYGYDEVANEMIGCVEFAESVIEVMKK